MGGVASEAGSAREGEEEEEKEEERSVLLTSGTPNDKNVQKKSQNLSEDNVCLVFFVSTTLSCDVIISQCGKCAGHNLSTRARWEFAKMLNFTFKSRRSE